ncbi:MAG: hypothetical protein ABW130_02330 [Candidatus Thiodiazotropha lotti]|nr:hypothetical protein [Candidatus Thiodiazotropha lotti]
MSDKELTVGLNLDWNKQIRIESESKAVVVVQQLAGLGSVSG